MPHPTTNGTSVKFGDFIPSGHPEIRTMPELRLKLRSSDEQLLCAFLVP